MCTGIAGLCGRSRSQRGHQQTDPRQPWFGAGQEDYYYYPTAIINRDCLFEGGCGEEGGIVNRGRCLTLTKEKKRGAGRESGRLDFLGLGLLFHFFP